MSRIRLLADTDWPAPLGSQVLVELPSFGVAGFSWEPKVAGNGLTLARSSADEGDPELPGSKITVFQIEVSRPGRHTIVFALKRPWETTARAERRLTIIAS